MKAPLPLKGHIPDLTSQHCSAAPQGQASAWDLEKRQSSRAQGCLHREEVGSSFRSLIHYCGNLCQTGFCSSGRPLCPIVPDSQTGLPETPQGGSGVGRKLLESCQQAAASSNSDHTTPRVPFSLMKACKPGELRVPDL